MNIITTIQAALTALNNTADLFMLEKSRAENEELNNTTDTIIVYPDWRTTNQFTQSLELSKTRVYNIDFKTPDEWDNSDGSAPSAYESKTSADRIEDMEVLADSVISYISAHNDLFPEITQKLKWTSPRPILRANNSTMSGVNVQLTVVFSGERICDYITTPVPVIPFPNPEDLNTWHKTITEKTFAESIVNLPAKFLPRVASFVTANLDYIDTGIDLSNATDIDLTVILYRASTGILSTCESAGVGSPRFGITWLNSDNVIYVIAANTATTFGSVLNTNTGWFTIRVVYDGSGVTDADKLKLYINGNLQTLAYTGQIPSSMGTITNNFFLGRGGNGYMTGLISYSSLSKDGTLQGEYYPTGQGDYEYDLSGNNNHGAWSGTGTRFDYDLEGSTYPNTNGYSLWQLIANDDIQVPFDINGLPLSLTAGVNIPAGYTKTRDIIAGGVNWNMSDALVDFDPDSLGSAEVAIFDRSNVTRQTAASRSSLFYDAANPYRYQINEIADPRIYDTFFESLFQNIIFGRIVLDGTDLIRYDEELNYKTQREGDTLAENIIYCRFITNIYP